MKCMQIVWLIGLYIRCKRGNYTLRCALSNGIVYVYFICVNIWGVRKIFLHAFCVVVPVIMSAVMELAPATAVRTPN